MTVCFHLGMTVNYIWYGGTPRECVETEEELDRIMKDIHYEFLDHRGKTQYSQKI